MLLEFVRDQNRKDLEVAREIISPLAWNWVRQFKAGYPAPGPDASQAELDGWRAYLRGFARRPVFVDEKLKQLKGEKAQ